KAAATRAAENGATAHELMAIFGWRDIKEAEIYTREAQRKKLASMAGAKLEKGTFYAPTISGGGCARAKSSTESIEILLLGALGGRSHLLRFQRLAETARKLGAFPA